MANGSESFPVVKHRMFQLVPFLIRNTKNSQMFTGNRKSEKSECLLLLHVVFMGNIPQDTVNFCHFKRYMIFLRCGLPHSEWGVTVF